LEISRARGSIGLEVAAEYIYIVPHLGVEKENENDIVEDWFGRLNARIFSGTSEHIYLPIMVDG
jgi:hypothetical protein